MDIPTVYGIAGMKNRDPLALYNGPYKEADQCAMKQGAWNYDDPDFLCNQIFIAIEALDPRQLTSEERVWFRRLRWFWNHHAISSAIWVKPSQRKAQEYAKTAMRLQKGDHQNHITCVLYYLVHDQPKKAKAHLRLIPDSGLTKEERHETGPWLIQQYESECWPFPKPA